MSKLLFSLFFHFSSFLYLLIVPIFAFEGEILLLLLLCHCILPVYLGSYNENSQTFTGELQDHTTIRGNDFVPGSTVQLRVWPMYQELIEAIVSNEIDWVSI